MEASQPRTARAREAAARAREAASSAGSRSLLVLGLGLIGGLLLIVTEFSTIVTVDVDQGTCEELADPEVRDACHTGGFEQHGGAFVLLGLLAFAMALGASRGSRPAAFALVGIAGIVLVFALLRDVPKAGETGLVGVRYEEAFATAGSGLYMEFAGAALLLLAGGLGLSRRRG